MKKIKSISTLFIALMLIVSMLGTTAFATGPYYGAANSEFTCGSATVTTHAGVAGKTTADYAHMITGKAGNAANNFIQTAGSYNKQATLECSFMIPDDTSVLGIHFLLYKNGTDGTGTSNRPSGDYIEISTSGIKSNKTTVNASNYSIEKNKWYNFAIVFPFGATNTKELGTMYLNGVNIGTLKFFNVPYSMAYSRIACGKDDSMIYLDNIYTYSDHAYSSAEFAPSTIVGVSDGYAISSNTIKVPEVANVADIKSALTTSAPDDEIRIYSDATCNASKELGAESAVTDDSVIVVASKNGTSMEKAYNYYNIEVMDPDSAMGRGKVASDLAVEDGTAVVSVPGNYGKSSSDDIYRIIKTSGRGIHLPKTFNNGSATLGASYGHLEFDFLLSEGTRIPMTLQYNTTVNTGTDAAPKYYDYHPLNIELGKLTSGSGSNRDKLCDIDVEANKWHSFAVTIPTDGSEDGLAYIYIDGIMVKTLPTEYGKGFRQPFIGFENGTDKLPIYIDNIKANKTNVYDADKCLSSWIDIDNAIIKGNKINYTVMPEASNFHPGANTNVRFYDADWNILADTDGAAYVVAGEKDADGYETSIKYYTFDSSAKDYIAGGYYDKDNNFYVKAYGKNAGDSLYYATYESANNDELSEVVADAMNTADNKAEISGTFSDKSYRFFFWDKDINPLVKSIALELKK